VLRAFPGSRLCRLVLLHHSLELLQYRFLASSEKDVGAPASRNCIRLMLLMAESDVSSDKQSFEQHGHEHCGSLPIHTLCRP
jgi:hypothetical protein